jgi:hypothetical protein
MSRGCLMFARGAPLGPHGLDWLYVHLANVWGQGVDKLSFDGRRWVAGGGLGRGGCRDHNLPDAKQQVHDWENQGQPA